MPNTFAANANAVMAESGFVVPDSYVGNTDQNIAQLFALANGVAYSAQEETWQLLRKTQTYTLTTSTTYPLPTDFGSFIPGTMYQHGRWDMVDIPTNEQVWALLNSIVGVASLPVRARIIAGQLNILNPQSGATLNVEYVSNCPITSASGTPQQIFLADTDIWLLDDRMFQLELKWRFKKEKGLDWQSDQIEADTKRAQVRGRDQGNSHIIPNQVGANGEPYANLWA